MAKLVTPEQLVEYHLYLMENRAHQAAEETKRTGWCCCSLMRHTVTILHITHESVIAARRQGGAAVQDHRPRRGRPVRWIRSQVCQALR